MTAKAAPKTLLEALLAFQADAPHIPLDSVNPHFRSKFASLPKVMDLVRPKLAENGLVWTTCPGHSESVGPVLRYTLSHAPSGESISGEMPLMLAKADPQGFGSAVTYARRYAVLAVLGLVGDEDDDANATKSEGTGPVAVPKPANQPKATGPKPITDKQKELLRKLYAEKGAEKIALAFVAAGLGNVKEENVGDAVNALSSVEASKVLDMLMPKKEAA